MFLVRVRRSLLTAVCLLSASLCLADDKPEGAWTVIDRDDGITISKRHQPGSSLPAFRGQGRIQGNVLQVLSLMLDLKGVQHWAHGVDSSKPIQRIDERSHLLYLTSDLPWPVRDRDMIVRADVQVLKPKEQFRITLHCEPKAYPDTDLLRVQQCQSVLILGKVDETTTEIDYQMTLDPGGYLPRWAIEF
ncbi:MAG TPA: START domain-containing protein, partial [Polyangiales bacterium]|nr:START domain-containing protein [Polyangiales bacterium]